MQVWRIDSGDSPRVMSAAGIDFERRLEAILAQDISLVSPDWMVIGRQVPTSFGKIVDLLAIDAYGNLVVLELKRDRTPRDVVAQALEYGQWVSGLTDQDIASFWRGFQSARGPAGGDSLDAAFLRRFGRQIPGELNTSHQIVIVAASLDSDSERVVQYLAESYNVPIGVVFFKVFKDGESEYLCRAWLAEPSPLSSAEAKAPNAEPWNNETYVSFGYPASIVNAGTKYGFVVAGGGSWYSSKLRSLEPGERVWVNRVGGYVGVGEVISGAEPVDRFTVTVDGAERLLSTLEFSEHQWRTEADAGADMADYAVRIKWAHTVSFDKAVTEKGFFGNQNPVARPVAQSWRYTVERLKALWGIA